MPSQFNPLQFCLTGENADILGHGAAPARFFEIVRDLGANGLKGQRLSGNLAANLQNMRAIARLDRNRAKLAFFQLGQVSIELIEPFNGPSTWQEFLDEKGEGVHHIAFEVDDAQASVAELEGMDMTMVQKGDYEGGSYTYVDAQKSLGLVLELLQND